MAEREFAKGNLTPDHSWVKGPQNTQTYGRLSADASNMIDLRLIKPWGWC